MIRGGLRARLVADSVRLTVIAGLQALGWFDPTVFDTPPGARQHQPVRYIARPDRWDIPIAANSIAISTEDLEDDDRGLGGEVEDRLNMYVDVLAEDDPVGWHIARDVRDLLFGHFPALGRSGPVVDVYDLRLATPAPFTQVDVEEIVVDRARNEAHEFQNHWFMIQVVLSDEYADEWDAVHISSDWSDELAPAWARIQAAETP